MKKEFIVNWNGNHKPPTQEDVFNILLDAGFDELAVFDVIEVTDTTEVEP